MTKWPTGLLDLDLLIQTFGVLEKMWLKVIKPSTSMKYIVRLVFFSMGPLSIGKESKQNV